MSVLLYNKPDQAAFSFVWEQKTFKQDQDKFISSLLSKTGMGAISTTAVLPRGIWIGLFTIATRKCLSKVEQKLHQLILIFSLERGAVTKLGAYVTQAKRVRERVPGHTAQRHLNLQLALCKTET